MEFSRQEYWNELPLPPPGYLPHPEIYPTSLLSPALAGRFFTTSATWEAHTTHYTCINTCPPQVLTYVCNGTCLRKVIRVLLVTVKFLAALVSIARKREGQA